MVHSPVSSPPPLLPPAIIGVNSRENYSGGNSLKNIFHSILSYNDNIMLAAVISLLLVILFVLLLHIYARWFFTHGRGTSSTVTVPHVAGPRRRSRHRRFHTFHVDSTFPDSPDKMGLDKSVISAIPLFIYNGKGNYDNNNEDDEYGLECSICLSCFENGDVGRKLPKCSHAFHAECIEMWLFSHSTCPVCRAPVVCGHASAATSSGLIGGAMEDERTNTAVTTSLEIVVELVPKRDGAENVAAAVAAVVDDKLTVSTPSSSSPSH